MIAVGLVVSSLAGCGGGGTGGDPAKQRQRVKRESRQLVRNWLTAAINQDAKQYCQLMTLDLKEQTTDAQSD